MKFPLLICFLVLIIISLHFAEANLLKCSKGKIFKERCKFTESPNTCNEKAEKLLKKEKGCKGYDLEGDFKKKICFKSCDNIAKCGEGFKLVAEDTTATNKSYPDCCAKCEPILKTMTTNEGFPATQNLNNIQIKGPPQFEITNPSQRTCANIYLDSLTNTYMMQECPITNCPLGTSVFQDFNLAFPNCCPSCRDILVNNNSIWSCRQQTSEENCKQFAESVSKKQHTCTGYSIDKQIITFEQCNNIDECPFGKSLQEDKTATYPDCCPSCETIQFEHGSVWRCDSNESSVCEESAKTLVRGQKKCTGYQIGLNNTVIYEHCPVIACSGNFIEEDPISENRKKFPDCCAKCSV